MTSLPPFIMTSEEGSFARKTIQQRKPLIIDKILSHYDFTPDIRTGLIIFKNELIQGQIVPLDEKTSDRSLWDSDIKPWIGKSWLEIPWFLAETYFYRRVLESVQYFQPGPWMHHDPYGRLKEKEISDALPVFDKVYPGKQSESSLENFQNTIYSALWGNRGDLSNLDSYETDMGEQTERILQNQTPSAYQFLVEKPTRIAYFLDNVGKELFFDLALIDYLMTSNLAQSITCYAKNQPFFVSDAMPKDIMETLNRLTSSPSKASQRLAKRIIANIQSKKIRILTPPFFTTSRMYRQMPEVLVNQIASHDLAILKGDVNFRRLFGDRHWDPTTKVAEAGGYFPTSFLSLRTLKAELILGVSAETIEKLESEAEPDWLINGKRGMVIFFNQKSK